MYKKLISKITLLCLCVCSLSMSSGFAVSLGAALDEMMTKLDADGTLAKVPGKSTVSSLYDKALTTVKKQVFQPYDQALLQTTQYFRNFDANSACTQIKQQDIAVVLYSTNLTFQHAIKDLFEQEKKELVIPITKTYNKATVCKQINTCMGTGFDVSTNALYIDSMQDCERIVTQVFQRSANAASFFNSLSRDTYGTEFFQNGTLDDSDYDLLVDISEIGRIMFDGYKPPLTTVFYGMPTLGSLFGGLGAGGLAGGGISDPSPDQQQSYTTSTGLFTINMGAVSPGTTPSTAVTPLGITFADIYNDYFTPHSTTPVVTTTSGSNHDVDVFIAQTNNSSPSTSLSAQSSSSSVSLDFLGQNACLAPYALSGPVLSGAIPVVSGSLVDSGLDVLLATPVPADVYDAISQDYYDAISPNLLVDAVGALFPLVASGSTQTPTQQQVEMAITTAVTKAFDLNSGPDDADVQSCLSQCDSLPFLDKLVCQSACLCSKFESPAIGNDTTDKIGVSLPKGAFALRFCRVAPAAAEMHKNKKVYSIEQIFSEIRNVFVSLRQSGQLFKTVKTKEFLDSGMKKNKFGDLFAFSIRVGTKPSYDNTPASIAKSTLEDADKAMQKKLLRNGGDQTLLSERNKYVVTADIAVQKAYAQGITDTTALSKLIEKERQTLAMASNTDAFNTMRDSAFDTMSSKLLNASTINTQVASFLDSNLQFWIFTYEKLLDINSLAGTFKKKIEKGK